MITLSSRHDNVVMTDYPCRRAVAGSGFRSLQYRFRGEPPMVSINFRPIWRYQDQLIGGLAITLLLTMVAAVIGLVIGVLGAVALRSGPKPVRRGIRAYVEIVRNTPVLIQIFIIYF